MPLSWVLFCSLIVSMHSPMASVYFSPKGGCQDAVVKLIDSAKKTVYMQAYGFTNRPIYDALVRAHNRNVSVIVILDKSHLKGAGLAVELLESGVETLIDRSHAIAHNKICLVDGETVLTGSFNFTNAAEKLNAENIFIVKIPSVFKLYLANFLEHKEHSFSFNH